MKKILIITLTLILILGFFFLFRNKPVETIHPLIGPITESVYAISTVRAERTFVLKLGVISSVAKYFVKEGDWVKENDKLLQVEEGNFFTSPHAGIVTERPFGIKETIAPQAPIIKVVDLSQLYLEASIEQQGALRISKGMKVIISFEDFRNKNFNGVVRSVLPRDQDFLLQIDSPDLPKNILPGMSADLSIEIATKENAVTIPARAISNGFIVLERNGKKEKSKVEIGISDSVNAEILAPALTENDNILLPKAKEN